MFKGLKTKIAEETKRIQDAVVNQVGEGLNNFTSSKRNDSSDPSRGHRNDAGEKTQHLSTSSGNNTDSSLLIDVERSPSRQSSIVSDSFMSAASSSFMQEAAEGELTPTRQRHDSFSSVGSVESNFFPSIPSGNNRLAPIHSDIETDVESVAGSSSYVSGASKEQIASVLNKLQGRAANYKDKYRQLASSFKEVSKENEKLRNVLTTSQDKALRRIQELREERKLDEKAKREMEESLRSKLLSNDGMIATLRHQVQLLKEGKPADDDVLNEIGVAHPTLTISTEREKVKKLEELLNRCKESIKGYKERIQTLSAENGELKKQVGEIKHEHEGNAELSEFVAGRTVNELKAQLKTVEETWSAKLAREMEQNSLTLAQIKQEMHLEIENKEKTIEELRQMVRDGETASAETMEKLNGDLVKAKETEKLLEKEKHDLIQEVSRSKQAAITVFKEEEEKKRDQLHKDFEQGIIEKSKEFEKKLKEAHEEYERKLAENEKELQKKLKENEEQMSLAIQERDLQKMAALAQHDRRIDELHAEIEALKTEKLELESSLSNFTVERRSDVQKVQQEIQAKLDEERKSAQIEVERLKATAEEARRLLDESSNEKRSLENQLKEVRREFAASREEFENLMTKNENLMAENQEVRRKFVDAEQEMRRICAEAENDEKSTTEKFDALEIESRKLEKELKKRDEDLDEARQHIAQLEVQAADLETRTLDAEAKKTARCEFMEKELQRVMDEKRLIEADFKQRLDELMQNKSSEVDDFRSQLNALKDSEVARVVAEFGQKEAALKQELQQRGDELMFARDTLKGKEAAVEELRSKSNRLQGEIEKIERRNDELMKKLAAGEEVARNLRSDVENARSLREEVKALQINLADSKSRVENLEREKLFVTEEKNMQIREANDVLSTLEDAVELYRKQMDLQMKENENMKQTMTKNARFQSTEADVRLDELRERIGDLEDAVDVYKTKYNENNAQATSKEQEIATLREKLQNVIRDQFFYSSEKDLRIGELYDKIAVLDTAVEDYQRQNESLKLEIERNAKQQEKMAAIEREEQKMAAEEVKMAAEERKVAEVERKVAAEELQRLTTSIRKMQASFGQVFACFDEFDEESLPNEEARTLIFNVRNMNDSFRNGAAGNEEEFYICYGESLRRLATSYVENEKKLVNFGESLVEFEEKAKTNETLAARFKMEAEEAARCKEEAARVEHSMEEAIREKETTIERLTLDLTEFMKNKEGFEREIEMLKGQVGQKVEEAKIEQQGEEERRKKVERDLEQISKELEAKTAENVILRQEMKNLEVQLDSVVKEKETLRNSADSDMKQVEEAKKKEVDEMTAKLKDVEAELKNMRNALEKNKKTEDESRKMEESLKQEVERLNADCEGRVAEYKKKAETKLSQMKKLLETDRETLTQRVVALERDLATKTEEFGRLEAEMVDKVSKLEAEMAEKEQDVQVKVAGKLQGVRDERAAAVDACREEYETKIRTMVEEHNEKVKQLAKEFQAEMGKKEEEWRDELSTAYNKTDEDRQRVTKEYQKGMKELYKDLQEKTQKMQEMKEELEKEKAEEMNALNANYEQILRDKEEQFKISLKQRLEDQAKEYRKEIDGLTNEWKADRRFASAAVVEQHSSNVDLRANSVENLESQAQVAQGDVKSESSIYLKQRVKQLESQLEAYKDKRRDADHVVKNSFNDHHNNERLSSVSLDYTNPVFCEPTEAEYLRNIVFRYMVERESLGKESVTLAKAIAAVLKLSFDQTKEVLAKEESRQSTW